MRNRNLDKKAKKMAKRSTANSAYDMYERTDKEKALEQLKRMKGPRCETCRPLKEELALLASTTSRKARAVIQSVAKVGFTFKFYPNGHFKTLPLLKLASERE